MPNKPVITIVDDDESVREATMSLMRALGFASEAYQCAEDFLKSGRIAAHLVLDRGRQDARDDRARAASSSGRIRRIQFLPS